MKHQIIERTDGTQGIKHLVCGLTSWDLNDVERKYCGNCHVFIEEEAREIVNQPRRHGKASGYANRMMTASNKKV